MTDRELLAHMFHAAVDAAQPGPRIRKLLPKPPVGRTIVVGAGKASAEMALAFDKAWKGPLSGLVAVPHGTKTTCPRIELAPAAHPVPDESGLEAARRMTALLEGLTVNDLVVALISGGGSSLLPAPTEGLSLADEQAINAALLASGAPISDMNLIRNQFSRLKGGRLALAAAPARLFTYVVSDVPGDDPAIVASGPTMASPRTRDEARRLIDLYDIALPYPAKRLLASNANPAPRPSDLLSMDHQVHVIASAAASLEAAAAIAQAEGMEVHILSDGIEGEAAAIGQMHAAIAREVAVRARPFAAPCVLLSGGETTVTLRGNGRGGRNTEFLLAFAEAIKGQAGISALAADTDGIDGRGGHAGAFCDVGSGERMRQDGLDPLALLRGNDSASAFDAVDDLFVTGPTGTNVNDFRAIIIR